MVEETPLYTLHKIVFTQFPGFQLYLIHNRKGSPEYPPGTSAMWALWRSFTRYKLMESVGDVVFFKDMRGEAVRAFAEAVNVDSSDGADDRKGDRGTEGDAEAMGVQDGKEDVMVD
ncbi:hypothetical protein FOMPIDRAFT_91441 [Fomitopsis schrenkii]|uniref:Uncharacterized protein n=1 Tax=Fomitopsis schrenkii TaxID=2126942 RepID=S8DIQ5_FOMSC|nr:hypothetical protein FOMPIDRAFT_91441 [Fomitopsis schrenkii]